MNAFLAGIQIIGGPLPIVAGIIAALAAVALAIRRTPPGWPLILVLAIAAGAAVGLLTCWVVGDLFNLFGVGFSPATRSWVALSFAGLGLAVANLWRSRPRRKIGAVASIVVFALLGALGVNADFGQYTTIGSITGISAYSTLADALLAQQRAAASTEQASAPNLWASWSAPADLPEHGIVGSVTIPATVSHFAARDALVYLPPAALVAQPPALPVLIMLSGQPGSPDDVFAAGHLATLLDAIAADNGGLAPIVVVPDQLSARTVNPMCVDSAIGNSATYLTVDVPAWIHANLDVESVPSAWSIGGFSQGGTCAVQLGAGHPELFGSFLDISGELEPKVGSTEATIAAGFAGDAAAYERAKPISIIAAHAPFADTVGIFAVGGLDTRFAPEMDAVASAAEQAGIHTTRLTSPGTAHDWWTVGYAVNNGLPAILRQMGLMGPLS